MPFELLTWLSTLMSKVRSLLEFSKQICFSIYVALDLNLFKGKLRGPAVWKAATNIGKLWYLLWCNVHSSLVMTLAIFYKTLIRDPHGFLVGMIWILDTLDLKAWCFLSHLPLSLTCFMRCCVILACVHTRLDCVGKCSIWAGNDKF